MRRQPDGPNESILSAFKEPDPELVESIERFLEGDPAGAKDHGWCNESVWEEGWLSDEQESRQRRGSGKQPQLLAEFVWFYPPAEPTGRYLYRIRIWSSRIPDDLNIVYVLHPPDEIKPGRLPILRGTVGSPHEQWINTALDYSIRVRSSDGREWEAGTVLDALRRNYTRTKGARVSGKGIRGQTADRAMAIIACQTARHDMSDELWKKVEPLVRGQYKENARLAGRASDRDALSGIIFLLRAGGSWDEAFPRWLQPESSARCKARLRVWQEKGVWDKVQRVLIAHLERPHRVAWSQTAPR